MRWLALILTSWARSVQLTPDSNRILQGTLLEARKHVHSPHQGAGRFTACGGGWQCLTAWPKATLHSVAVSLHSEN